MNREVEPLRQAEDDEEMEAVMKIVEEKLKG